MCRAVAARRGTGTHKLRDAERHNTFSARQTAAKVTKVAAIDSVCLLEPITEYFIRSTPRQSRPNKAGLDVCLSVRPYVRTGTSVRPQKVSPIRMKFGV